jgi:hypothetical protein
MTHFTPPKSTRGQWLLTGLHIGMLAVALVIAWQKDGPPPDKAFWAIMSYFVEIAVAGIVEVIVTLLRRSRGEA